MELPLVIKKANNRYQSILDEYQDQESKPGLLKVSMDLKDQKIRKIKLRQKI